MGVGSPWSLLLRVHVQVHMYVLNSHSKSALTYMYVLNSHSKSALT